MAHSITSLQQPVGTDGRLGGIVKSALQRLWSPITAAKLRFTSGIRDIDHSFATGVTSVLDIDRISAQLGVERRAQTDGRNELPPATDEAVRGTQLEIVVYFRELQRKAYGQIAQLANKQRELSERIDLSGTSSRLGDIPSRYENDVRRLIAESRARLNFLVEREAQQGQHYDRLCEERRGTEGREQRTSVIVHLALMAGLAGAGAIAIGRILLPAPGVEGLLPPVWVISSVFLVVLVSYLLARAVSHIVTHISQWFAWPGGAASIASIAFVAALAARYMEIMKADSEVSIRSVVDILFLQPANVITQMADWKNFLVCLSAGLVAFVIGYQRAGRSPVATLQRARYRTRWRHERLTKSLRMQVNRIADNADAEVTALLMRLKASSSDYSGLVDRAQRLPVLLGDYDVALEDGCNILLDRYRVANKSARQTGIPVSFSEHICFRPSHEADFSILGNGEQRLAEFHQGITSFESDAIEVRQKLRDINSRAIGALEDAPG